MQMLSEEGEKNNCESETVNVVCLSFLECLWQQWAMIAPLGAAAWSLFMYQLKSPFFPILAKMLSRYLHGVRFLFVQLGNTSNKFLLRK